MSSFLAPGSGRKACGMWLCRVLGEAGLQAGLVPTARERAGLAHSPAPCLQIDFVKWTCSRRDAWPCWAVLAPTACTEPMCKPTFNTEYSHQHLATEVPSWLAQEGSRVSSRDSPLAGTVGIPPAFLNNSVKQPHVSHY